MSDFCFSYIVSKKYKNIFIFEISLRVLTLESNLHVLMRLWGNVL
jgi:hypothetical protein